MSFAMMLGLTYSALSVAGTSTYKIGATNSNGTWYTATNPSQVWSDGNSKGYGSTAIPCDYVGAVLGE